MSMTLEQPGQRSVSVALDDPFNLFAPSFDPGPAKTRHKPASFGSAQIDASSKVQTFLPSAVEPTFSDPLLRKPVLESAYVPKAEYLKVKKSARDGWFAVMVLGTFIAGGIYYIVERISSDSIKIGTLTHQVTDLNKQLDAERGVVVTRNKEIQLLNEQLADQRRRLAQPARRTGQ